MAGATEAAARSHRDFDLAIELLGGDKVFPRSVRTPLEAHEVILNGFPGTTLTNLVGKVPVMRETGVLEKAVGISLRTFQRRKKGGESTSLNREQSGRTWKFAEIFAKAIRIFGSLEDAEEWLNRPAIGLDQRRPIDLLATSAGVEIVEEYLERVEYGVYA